MIQVVTQLVQMYEDMRPMADPRTKDWLLVSGSPIPVWCLTVAYLSFVFLGQKWMRGRPAFSIQPLVFVYNIALVGLCSYMFVENILSTRDAGYEFLCVAYSEKTRDNPKELRVAKVLWWFFLSKAIELTDTVFMVLRKKSRQISFLHVYHHSSVLNIGWWAMMFTPGGVLWFSCCLNSLVHVIMYSYYALSLFPSLKRKLWWKRYLTMFQLLQFVCILSHLLYNIYIECDFPVRAEYLISSHFLAMLILFTNFYIHAYTKRRKDRLHVGQGDGLTMGLASNESTSGLIADSTALRVNKKMA